MHLSSEEALQIVTLVLLACMSALGVACIFYVFRFRLKILRGSSASSTGSNGSRTAGINLRHLRDFNSPWLLRVLLSGLGITWLVLELLRLPILRKKGWALHNLGFQQQANLCRSYVLLSLGLAEPAFFLTALFLIRESLSSDPFSFTKRRWRYRAVSFIWLLCTPVLVVQLFLAFVAPAFEYPRGSYVEQNEGFKGAIPKSFTMAFLNETRTETGTTGTGTRTAATTAADAPSPSSTPSSSSGFSAACRTPLLSTVAMSVFGICYVIYFLYLGWRMVLLVINRRLQGRVYGLLLVVVVLVPLHLLLLGLSSSALKRSTTYEIVAFLRFLTIVLCVSLGQWMLVFRPITDAITVLESSLKRGGSVKVSRLNSWGAIPVDQFSLPLSATFSVDEDRSSLITELSVELGTPAAAAGASSKQDEENGGGGGGEGNALLAKNEEAA